MSLMKKLFDKLLTPKDDHCSSLKDKVKKLSGELEKTVKYNQLTEDKLLKFCNRLESIKNARNKLPPNYQQRLDKELDKLYSSYSYKRIFNREFEMQTSTSFSSEVRLVNDNSRKSRQECKNFTETRAGNWQSSSRDNTYESNLPNRKHTLKIKSEPEAENVDIEHGRTHCSTVSYENEVKDKSTPNKGKGMPGVHSYRSLQTEQEQRPSDGKQFQNRVDNRSQKDQTYKSGQGSFNRSPHQSENTKNITTQNVRQLTKKFENEMEYRSTPEVDHQKRITRSQAKEEALEENDNSRSKKSVDQQSRNVDQNKYDFCLNRGTSPEDGKRYREEQNYAYQGQSMEKMSSMEVERKIRELQSSTEQAEDQEKNRCYNQQNYNERRYPESYNYQKTYQHDNHQHRSSQENIHEQFTQKNFQIERQSQRKNIEAAVQQREFSRRKSKEEEDCDMNRKFRELQFCQEEGEKHGKARDNYLQEPHNERRHDYNYKNTYLQDNHQHRTSRENIHEQFTEKFHQIERESQRKHIEAAVQRGEFSRRKPKEEEDWDMNRQFSQKQPEEQGKPRDNYQQERHNEGRHRDDYNYKKSYLQDNHQHRVSPEPQHMSKNIHEQGKYQQVYNMESQFRNIEASDQSRGSSTRKSREGEHFMELDRKLTEEFEEQRRNSGYYYQKHNERRYPDNYNYNEKTYLQDNHQHRASPELQHYQSYYGQHLEKNHQFQEREPQEMNIETAKEVVADEPIEILDVHQYFADFDLTTLDDSVDAMTQVKTVEEWAKTFEDKVETFSEERYSLGYFVIDEKLMRLIEHLDKLKCQDDEEATTKKIAVIQYINKLHNTLDTNAKDD